MIELSTICYTQLAILTRIVCTSVCLSWFEREEPSIQGSISWSEGEEPSIQGSTREYASSLLHRGPRLLGYSQPPSQAEDLRLTSSQQRPQAQLTVIVDVEWLLRLILTTRHGTMSQWLPMPVKLSGPVDLLRRVHCCWRHLVESIGMSHGRTNGIGCTKKERYAAIRYII